MFYINAESQAGLMGEVITLMDLKGMWRIFVLTGANFKLTPN